MAFVIGHLITISITTWVIACHIMSEPVDPALSIKIRFWLADVYNSLHIPLNPMGNRKIFQKVKIQLTNFRGILHGCAGAWVVGHRVHTQILSSQSETLAGACVVLREEASD